MAGVEPRTSLLDCDYWDLNSTWYADVPDFSHSLKSTVLVWIPCAFLWLLLPLEIISHVKSQFRNIPYSRINLSKMVCLILLGGMGVTNIVNNILANGGLSVNAVSSYIKLATIILCFGLVILGMIRGIFTSGVQLSFWVLSSLCQLLVFWSNFFHSDNKLNNYLDGASFILSTFMMLLSFFSDHKPLYRLIQNQEGFVDVKHETEEEFASCFSRIVYHWLNRTIWRLRKRRPVEDVDFFCLTQEEKASTTTKILEQHINNLQERDGGKTNIYKGNILLPILKAFGPNLLGVLVFQIMADVLKCVLPLVFWLIMDFSTSEDSLWKGVLYCVLLFSGQFLSTLFSEIYANQAIKTGGKIKSSLVALIFNKIFNLSSSVRYSTSIGEILNCVSVDVQKLYVLTTQIHQLLSLPIQISLTAYILWRVMGVAALIGLSLTLIMVPLVTMLAKIKKSLEMKYMRLADIRIKTTSDILSGIKVLKLYGWEMSFHDVILNLRNDEYKVLFKISLVSSFALCVWVVLPLVFQFVAISSFLKIETSQYLTPVVAFVSLRFFLSTKVLIEPFNEMINSMTLGIVAIKRINKVLQSVEVENYVIRNRERYDDNTAISVENGSFKWSTSAQLNILSDISFVVPKGSLVAVVGEVGSGKSSLISALLGGMEKLLGLVYVQGSVAYVPQQAWILNTSVKDNITFNTPFNEEKYEIVIDGCALGPDLKILPAHDETEIGERGINLSGGQKQRISLARAVYSDADVYLMDDPLGAVDAHVGKHIFDKVIGPQGILKDKTRLLVTHKVQNLSLFDLIIVLRSGEIEDHGSYQDMLNRNKICSRDGTVPKNIASTSKISPKFKKRICDDLQNIKSETSIGYNNQLSKEYKKKDLIKKENNEGNSMLWSVFLKYIKAVGFVRTALSIMLYCGSAVLFLLFLIYLRALTKDMRSKTESQNYDLTICGCLIVGQFLVMMLGGAATFKGTIVVAEKFHRDMLKSVLRSPMSFFDTTPTGRILNRFTKDIEELDSNMMLIISRLIATTSAVICYIIALAIYIPELLIAVFVVLALSVIPQKLYAASSSFIKRMDTTTRSPIFSHFTESIDGVSVIKAYKQTEIFVKKAFDLVDSHGATEYLKNIIIRWLAIRLNCLYATMYFLAALTIVIERGRYSSGTVGLVLNISYQISYSLTVVLACSTSLESSMVSIERILEYCQLESEAPFEIGDTKLSSDWPSEGKIVFNEYSTLYRKELDPVLKHVSFSINSMEKVGVVGRTGAGKSSLTLALFRLLEAHTGTITIDGVDISQLGLFDLRSRLTIIPQDPVLFAGSIRLNLDPFNRHTDAEIWTALEQAHLKRFVHTFQGGLNHVVSEGGQSLSVGQRQLLCLARALLRRTKVLILDEATASVDMDTDDLIQATIREEFSASTIITIAHRIQTIMDYDRVMVLNNGLLEEFDSPTNLLKEKTSLFFGLSKEAGLA